MGKTIGIDLGTTNCVVTIPENRTGKYFVNIPECPGCTVITDRFHRLIVPSVVAEDDNGNIVVGSKAKGRAGLSPGPIMFAKRSMGERKTFTLDKQGQLTSKDATVHIIRHLKELAEEQLGEPVDEAVITVPAYFSLLAKQETKEAAEIAGLKVKQIAQEPIAAAMMYCASDSRDPLRIMTYDLGGGTFDVAILEKKDGVIASNSILAFDGDRYVGGYNFDNKLAFWIMDQLKIQGYDLELDSENPKDQVIFARLMVLAEQAKCELSKEPVANILDDTGRILDHGDNPVHINLEISRDQFEDMIRTEVEYTLQICNRALTEKPKKPLKPEDIDEVIMVGGSSRIPMVAQRLEQEFGIKPKLVAPDLCVALGAAVIAGAGVGTLDYMELGNIPRQTELDSLSISGKVVPGEELDEVSGCSVRLLATDGSYNRCQTVGPEGGFVFDSVPLAFDDTTEFRLSVTSAAGEEVTCHEFSVCQTAAPVTEGLVEGEVHAIPDLLAKAISIMWADGSEIIAPAQTSLPFETTIMAKTVDTSGRIEIPILEENNTIGKIVVEDIPETLTVGSLVQVSVTIREDFQLECRAHVKALAREEKVSISVPPPPVKTLDELRGEYEELQMQAENALGAAGIGAAFGDASAKRLEGRLAHAREMLNGRDGDTPRIQACLDEVRTIIKNLTSGWKPRPPRTIFEQKAAEANELIERLGSEKPEAAEDGYDDRLADIRKEAEDAYQAQNGAAWSDVYTRVVKLCDDVDRILEPAGVGPPPDPSQILLQLATGLNQLRERAERSNKLDAELEAEFNAAAASLKQIDPNAPDAMNQIRDWYMTKYEAIQEKVTGVKPPQGEDEKGRLKRLGNQGQG